MIRRIFVLLITLGCSFSCAAQCISGDCKNGEGKMDMGYAVYEGGFKNGQPQGQGTLDYGDGEKFVGHFEKGKEEGSGTLYKKGKATRVNYKAGELQSAPSEPLVIGGNGDYKEKVPGCISGDCYNGYGEINFPSGNRYKGGFKNNQFSGQGTMTFSTGNVLTAEFEAHNPVKGSFYYADNKTTFNGTFNSDGTPNTGTYTNPGLDGIVTVADGKIMSEKHPKRDSLNAIVAKHARDFQVCPACNGKGEYMFTSYSPIKTERSEWISQDGLGAGYVNNIIYKTTGGFSQSKVTCKICGGKGEIKR